MAKKSQKTLAHVENVRIITAKPDELAKRNRRKTMAATYKEIHEGLNGSGKRVWIVVTVNEGGHWIWQEIFTNKAEAESWLKYA